MFDDIRREAFEMAKAARSGQLEAIPVQIETSGIAAAFDNVEPKAPVKRRPPKILIVGLRPTARGQVTEKINGTADIQWWTTEDGLLVLRSLVKTADKVLVASGGMVNHSDTEALTRDGIEWTKAQNSQSGVLAAIREWLDEIRAKKQEKTP